MRTRRSIRAGRAMRPGQRGMTLLEIMIVIAILGILASVIVVSVMNQLVTAKIKITEIKLNQTGQVVQAFNARVGRYPTEGEGLHALVTPPDGSRPLVDSEPRDAWENPIVYKTPAVRTRAPFELISKGEDGRIDTDDDISSERRRALADNR